MGGLFSWRRPDPQTPIKGMGDRLKNMFLVHFRGLIGVLVPIAALTWQGQFGKHDISVKLLWMALFWAFLWQPVSNESAGFIPMFVLPMSGVLESQETCRCYCTDGACLYLLGSMVHMLMNNSGVDRRIATWFLCSGDMRCFSGKRLLYNASAASFFLSMWCNKLIVTSNLIDTVTRILGNLQSATARSRGSEPNYDEMRYIVNNAIQTSSSIGCICVLHSSYSVLFFRSIWNMSAGTGKEYPDIFNYLQYCAFAIPLALVMFFFNLFYHMILMDRMVGQQMSGYALGEVTKAFKSMKDNLPKKIGSHEKISVFFTGLAFLMFVFRWCSWLNMGWAAFRTNTASPDLPVIRDASVAAIFFCMLHILPKSLGFTKYLTITKKSELKPIKPESAIMYWSFVNKNANYGYIFILGAGTALAVASNQTKLANSIAAGVGKCLTNHTWNLSIFFVVMVASILANSMSGVSACSIFLPFVTSMAVAPDAPEPWPTRVYLGALGVGIATSFTFMFPFMYTPAYFCHHTGKVPIKKMAMYSIISVIVCAVILWLALCYWAPVIWDPTGKGFSALDSGIAAGGDKKAAGDDKTDTNKPPPPAGGGDPPAGGGDPPAGGA